MSAHRSRHTIAYLRSRVPEFIELEVQGNEFYCSHSHSQFNSRKALFRCLIPTPVPFPYNHSHSLPFPFRKPRYFSANKNEVFPNENNNENVHEHVPEHEIIHIPIPVEMYFFISFPMDPAWGIPFPWEIQFQCTSGLWIGKLATKQPGSKSCR